VIHLARAPRGDRIVSAIVTVNGKRVAVRHGKRLTARINIKGLPKGAARIAITLKTAKHRTLRSARTFHTCGRRRK
jgi:hypothetical protein